MEFLVHVDQFQQSRNRLTAAVALAERHKARLIGLAVAPDPSMTATMVGAAPANMVSMLNAAMEENLGAAEAQFNTALSTTGLHYEFRRDTGSAADILSLHARYADLTILGQTDPDDEIKSWLDHSVPLLAGGPVLVIPYAGHFSKIGTRPMIAWNGTREAARAVKDAMVFLQRADAVDVLEVVTDRKKLDAAQARTSDLCTFLARHGVKAEASQLLASEIEISDLIISRMADLGSDLLVMGAYGHSRFREVVMGGVTRDVLRSTPVPILLAH
jgi:nucleotide-binding universal stress UspA family protein